MTHSSEIAVYTIGHSNHAFEHFVHLLRLHDVVGVADVRSAPYSRHFQHFNRENLCSALSSMGIEYGFLGALLGARPKDVACYKDGRVVFALLARTAEFQDGLKVLQNAASKHHVAIMCAERDPIECHRAILISKHLKRLAISVRHIMPDGSLEDHSKTEERLVGMLNLQLTLFDPVLTGQDLLDRAYENQEQRIAFTAHEPSKLYDLGQTRSVESDQHIYNRFWQEERARIL